MSSLIQLSHEIQNRLSCPICRGKLDRVEEQLKCQAPQCGVIFPILDGIPVLINEKSSLFSISDFLSQRNTFFKNLSESRTKKILQKLIPKIGQNIKGKSNFIEFRNLLLKEISSPVVLVIGGSILGDGMESLANCSKLELVETDVSFGPRTRLICDAHDIPFVDKSFDGVVIQAVLEHVVDPFRCCEEIHRVLKKNGLVFAETPFIQQVHGGSYDFMRFTQLGHRRLFRKFAEIKSGVTCGPGMALAWSYQYFLLSFTTSRRLRSLIRIFSCLSAFFLKYFDHFLIEKPGAIDAASGFYFIGRKQNFALSDHDLTKLYKGAF